MPKVTHVQSNFNGGEWSPLAHGRIDINKYNNALEECTNFLLTQQGGLVRRSGTRYTATAKTNTGNTRLVQFRSTDGTDYMLEVGHQYIRVLKVDGNVVVTSADAFSTAVGVEYYAGDIVSYSGGFYRCKADNTGSSNLIADPAYWTLLAGGIVEFPTDITSAQIWSTNFKSIGNVIYVSRGDSELRKIRRTSDVVWTYESVLMADGPYLNVNTTQNMATPQDYLVSPIEARFVFDSTEGINDGVGFGAADVVANRAFRFKSNGVWRWGRITSSPNPTEIVVTIGSFDRAVIPYPAAVLANVSGGSVLQALVTDGGFGYEAQFPQIYIWGKPTTSEAVISLTVVGGVITAATLVSGGSGYANGSLTPTPDYVWIRDTTGSGAVIASYVAGYTVTAITLVSGGSGYSPNPEVLAVAPGPGSGAVVYANVSNGVVSSVTVASAGSGYTGGAVIMVDNPKKVVLARTLSWRLGAITPDNNPSVVSFHQNRLCLSGYPDDPGRVDMSNTGDYENFAPSGTDGTITDSNAMTWNIDSGPVKWLESDEWGLIVGASDSEWVIAPSTSQQAITPTNINAKLLGNYGSSSTVPVRVGKVVLFVQRTGRKIREMIYQFINSTFQAADISLVAEHLTLSGLKQLVVQFAPFQNVWMNKNDGNIAAMTYDRDQEVNGWHKHFLGGRYDTSDNPPKILSIACMPAADGLSDEVWFVVDRLVNGAILRSIETMNKVWEDGDEVADSLYLDCGLSYSGTPITTVSGLGHLVGETVGVLADGAVHLDRVVNSSGEITLQTAASKVQVGLKYTSRIKTMRLEVGGQDGPSQGKMKRIYQATLRFFQSIGLKVGSDAYAVDTYDLPFRNTDDLMDAPPSLFSGDKQWPYEGTYTTDGQMYFETDYPTPCNITMLVARIETQDNL